MQLHWIFSLSHFWIYSSQSSIPFLVYFNFIKVHWWRKKVGVVCKSVDTLNYQQRIHFQFCETDFSYEFYIHVWTQINIHIFTVVVLFNNTLCILEYLNIRNVNFIYVYIWYLHFCTRFSLQYIERNCAWAFYRI